MEMNTCFAFAAWLKGNHTGRTKAVTSKEMVGWGSGTTIRQMANALRVEGYPICSSGRGYYYAETPEDIHGTIKFLDSYVDNILRARNGLIDAIRQGDPQ